MVVCSYLIEIAGNQVTGNSASVMFKKMNIKMKNVHLFSLNINVSVYFYIHILHTDFKLLFFACNRHHVENANE